MKINQRMVVMKLVIHNHLPNCIPVWPKSLWYFKRNFINTQSLSQPSNKCTDETTEQTEWDKCPDLDKTCKTGAGLKKHQAGVNLSINLNLCFTEVCKNNRRAGFLYTPYEVKILCKLLFGSLAGLILATYCVRYPHAMPFLWNKMPCSLLKTPKTHDVYGSVAL